MVAHMHSRSTALEILRVDVKGSRIVDLRDHSMLEQLGIDPTDASASWQGVVAAGGTPTSWTVRDRLFAAGANGLIDPSRKRPGLWHLVLFRWNEPDTPAVRPRPLT